MSDEARRLTPERVWVAQNRALFFRVCAETVSSGENVWVREMAGKLSASLRSRPGHSPSHRQIQWLHRNGVFRCVVVGCGRLAHTVTGLEGYCERHREQALAARKRQSVWALARLDATAANLDEADRRRRRVDAALRFARGRNQKSRGRWH